MTKLQTIPPDPVDKSPNGECVPVTEETMRLAEARAVKIGRPTLFTPDMAVSICKRLAAGETLVAICRDPEMPERETVLRWKRENQAFSHRYSRARHDQMDCFGDQNIDIADDGSTDFILRKGRNGVEYEAVDQEHIQRSRLRVDARRFLMSKIAPHVYGDHIEHSHTGDVTVTHELSDKERMRRMAYFLMEDKAQGVLIEQADDSVAAGGDGDTSNPEA